METLWFLFRIVLGGILLGLGGAALATLLEDRYLVSRRRRRFDMADYITILVFASVCIMTAGAILGGGL